MSESKLSEQLRAAADAHVDYMTPYWIDEAKRLMRWAADTIEAAEAALSIPAPAGHAGNTHRDAQGTIRTLEARLASVRTTTLEEAARMAERMFPSDYPDSHRKLAAAHVATATRALKPSLPLDGDAE